MKLKLKSGVAFAWCGVAMLAFTAAAWAACPSVATASRYSYASIAYGSDAANNVVTDAKTGLQWRRCSQGQTWSGSACTGSVSGFTHEEALSHAAAQSGWRLPNKNELSSVADRGCANPAVDALAFPNTPSSLFWSSSPYVGDSDYAWSVDFGSGYVVSLSNRNNANHVRLVRASQ